MTDIIGVGQISGNDHLAGANRQIEATQDPGKDLKQDNKISLYINALMSLDYHL